MVGAGSDGVGRSLEPLDFLGAFEAAWRDFARTVAACDADAPVHTCAPWRVRDLVAHLGRVHLWATNIVAGGGPGDPVLDPPQFDGDLLGWYREAAAGLAQKLADCDPDVAVWTFWGAGPARFWFRRQTHETLIHVADAMLASGAQGQYPAAFADDAVSEVFEVILPRALGRTPGSNPILAPVLFHATDTGGCWLVRIGESAGVEVTSGARPGGPEVAEVWAAADELALGLWGRISRDRWRIRGPREIAERLRHGRFTT